MTGLVFTGVDALGYEGSLSLVNGRGVVDCVWCEGVPEAVDVVVRPMGRSTMRCACGTVYAEPVREWDSVEFRFG